MNISQKVSQMPTHYQKPMTQENMANESLQTKTINESSLTLKKEDIQEAVDRTNEFLNIDRTSVKFIFHEELDKYYVTVVNPLTDEVIREIPPKKMLDMYAAMHELVGIVVDEHV